MVNVFEIEKFVGTPLMYPSVFGSKVVTYTGQTEQKEKKDYSGRRFMEIKYKFTGPDGSPLVLTGDNVVTLKPLSGVMGGRMMRRQRSQRRGRKQRSQRRGRQQRRKRTQRRH